MSITIVLSELTPSLLHSIEKKEFIGTVWHGKFKEIKFIMNQTFFSKTLSFALLLTLHKLATLARHKV